MEETKRPKTKIESMEAGHFPKALRLTKDMNLNRKKREKITKKREVFKGGGNIKMPPVTKKMKMEKKDKQRAYQFHQSLNREGANQDLFQFRH